GPGPLPPLGPAADLAREEALRLAQGLETHPPRVDGLELDEGVDQHLGELAVGDGVAAAAELGRDEAAHHDAPAPLHDEEGRPDDRGIVAVEIGARGGWKR